MGILDIEPRAQRFTVTAGAVDPDPEGVEGLNPAEREQVGKAVARLRERIIARQDRDFAKSDAIRLELEESGFAVKDTAKGTVLERYQ
jgi:cysteinyl-tRNA synthetase